MGAELDNEALEAQHTDDSGLYGILVLKELVAPWINSNRQVIVDSYFTLVPAALEMHADGLRLLVR